MERKYTHTRLRIGRIKLNPQTTSYLNLLLPMRLIRGEIIIATRALLEGHFEGEIKWEVKKYPDTLIR